MPNLTQPLSMMRFYLYFIVAAGALLGCKPAGGTKHSSTTPTAGATFETRFPMKFGMQDVQLQVALTELEKASGLMYRQSLGENEGMLFVFPRNEPRAFWMHNVPINISLGYLTEDGKLDEIKALYAEDPTSVPSRSQQIRYVIELPEGWFEKTKTSVGAQLDLRAARAAITARGFDAERFLPKSSVVEQ